MNILKYGLICSLIILAGCEQKYRYPCQDPENWEKIECKKPLCEVNRDCPEYIFKSENFKTSATKDEIMKKTTANCCPTNKGEVK